MNVILIMDKSSARATSSSQSESDSADIAAGSHRLAGIQPVLEAATGQKLHYDERMALQGADIENLDNMRMTELNGAKRISRAKRSRNSGPAAALSAATGIPSTTSVSRW